MKDKLETAIRDLIDLLRATKSRDAEIAGDMLDDVQAATRAGDFEQATKFLRSVDRSVWMRTVRTSTLTVQQALKLARVEASLSAAITP